MAVEGAVHVVLPAAAAGDLVPLGLDLELGLGEVAAAAVCFLFCFLFLFSKLNFRSFEQGCRIDDVKNVHNREKNILLTMQN